jgi:BirA family biotin operon repressor/biotin-[acetyl-CoA-carboxylase] ligase
MNRQAMANERFDLLAVEEAIVGTEFAGRLMHFSSVASTNDLAHDATKLGVRHGVWIADEQTAGRGRGSHVWHSVIGEGLYLSALTSTPISMQNALGLSMRAALAVQSAIAQVSGFRVRDEIDIRWPNDLLLNGRKCCGILIETSAQPAPATGPAILGHAIIGIGVNVNHTVFPSEIDSIATSLRRELYESSQPIAREPLAAAILVALDEEIRRLTASAADTTRDLTEYSSWISGKRVRVEARDDDPGGYTGITAGLDSSGFLRVNGDDGKLHTILSGGLREA